MLKTSLKDLNSSSEELKEIAKLLAKKEVLKPIKACLKINALSALKAS